MITFTSNDTDEQQLVIGGTATLNTEKGIVGPFPRYSISREDLTLADGTYLNSKFNITVTGTATLKSGDSQDMVKKGERQSRVQGEAIILAQLNRTNEWPFRGNGVLEITAYGGINTNTIKYIDARITSIDLPEQNETAGVQNQEYTIQFEAYQDTSSGGNANSPGAIEQPDYNLSSVEESWDIAAEDRYSYTGNVPTGTINRVYTLTHTVSATGLRKFAIASSTVTDAWKEAYDFVHDATNQLVDSNPVTTITKNTLGLTNTDSSFSVLTNLGHTLTDYVAYDHVRTVNSNKAAGSYAVTDTWVLAKGSTDKAVIDMEISVDNSNVESANTVTLSGTVTGLEENATTPSTTPAKYANALAAYKLLAAKFFEAAKAAHVAYLNIEPDQPLKSTEYSKNVSENEALGTITFSVSFNDKITKNEDVIEDTLQVDDSGGTDVVAIIGVLLRAAGPVIQDMGTVTEKRKSVTYTAKLKTDKREDKPTFGKGIVDEYKPGGSSTSYLAGNSESWNETTGDYSVTREWVYATSGDGFQGADAPAPAPTPT